MYHFDIIVDWDMDGAVQGMFFASFPADLLARTLRLGQIPSHRLLQHRKIPGLIEIRARTLVKPARNSVRRVFLCLHDSGFPAWLKIATVTRFYFE